MCLDGIDTRYDLCALRVEKPRKAIYISMSSIIIQFCSFLLPLSSVDIGTLNKYAWLYLVANNIYYYTGTWLDMQYELQLIRLTNKATCIAMVAMYFI